MFWLTQISSCEDLRGVDSNTAMNRVLGINCVNLASTLGAKNIGLGEVSIQVLRRGECCKSHDHATCEDGYGSPSHVSSLIAIWLFILQAI